MGDFDPNLDRRRSGRGRSDRNRGRFGGRGRDRDSGRDRGRNRRSENQEMHKVTCDKCAKDCEVPFKPTQGKPIYCDDCFRNKSREAGSRSEIGKPNLNLDQINKKLDTIIKLLEAKKEPVEVKKPKGIEKEKPKSIEKSKSAEKEKPKSIEKVKPKKKTVKKKK